MTVHLSIIFISIVFSAFFSGMEIAYISANKIHIEIEKNKHGFFAKILSKITEKPSKFITTMLVGNNIALVIYSYFMGKLLVSWFQTFLPTNIQIINYFLIELNLLTQTLISTILILITAEFLPKAIFRIYANETVKFFAFPAYIFYVMFHVITEFISRISNFLLKLFFRTTESTNPKEFSKEELGNYISEQIETNDKELDSEIQIFQNALIFDKVKAREIMVPRTEIIAIEIHETVSNLKQKFIETGLSKILVYKNSMDDILGYVSAFELFKKPKTIKSILLPVEIIPESMIINNVLDLLMKKRKSIAVVIDEYGGTSGIITVEDIIEELFGEIEDEHDNLMLLEEKINNREFNFSARLEVDYLNENYETLNIPKQDSYETLGGFIISHTESIPEEKDIVVIGNLHIEITEASTTKINNVYIKIIDKDS